MLKAKVTVLYNDKKKQIFECVRWPYIEGPFYCLSITEEATIQIPTAYIQRVLIQQIYKKQKGNQLIDHWSPN
jgi:hypothetical protein